MGGTNNKLRASDSERLNSGASAVNKVARARAIIALGEDDCRLYFKQLVKATLHDPLGGQLFLSELRPPKHIRLNSGKLRVWIKASKFFASTIRDEGRSAVWNLYEELLSDERSKMLGQHFTPSHIAAFALSGIKGNPKSILDPMAGHGVFLHQALQRYPSAKLVGVDIDPLPLIAARLKVGDKVDLISADVFKWAKDWVTNDSESSFSAVVGNPAYVSYQNLPSVWQFNNSNGKRKTDYKGFLLEALKDIAKEKGVESDLKELLKSWSGLSDFSGYTLVLAWLLADPDGQIAFVISNHWMERNYGEGLRHFFASQGTVRGVVTHRGGNWFPRAQIPASVFVFSKGTVSTRQKSKGIPYVEIEGPYTSNIEEYLRSHLNLDFWEWLDSLSEAGQYEPLHVSFRRWLRPPEGRKDSAVSLTNNLHLPVWFKTARISELDTIGWSVHQGLRTGCNKIFYLEKVRGKRRQYVARPTKGGKRLEISLSIPECLLLPTIRKLPRSAPLIVSKKQADVYLLNLNRALLDEDRKSLYNYPDQWLNTWGVDNIEEIPEQLASYLREWATTPYEGKGKVKGPVMGLSAVKTNVYKPPLESKKVPRPPRFWYQIPLKERHFGEIFVPRVSAGPVRGFLVRDPGSVVIDANYLTFIPRSNAISSRRLWIWLNSNAFRILCELNGAALGGGALKVEAALLSRVPVPQSVYSTGAQHIDQLCRMLELDQMSNEALIETGRRIDTSLFGVKIATSNVAMLKRLVNKRQRRS